jgi:hypothetical protein
MIYLANLIQQLSLQPAREVGKWAWNENPKAPRQVGLKQNLGELETQV